MTGQLPPAVWVPVQLRFRHVRAGDVFVGTDGTSLWHVSGTWAHHEAGTITATVWQGGDECGVTVDPDETVHVLIPVLERDAVNTLADEGLLPLQRWLIDRRLNGDPTTV